MLSLNLQKLFTIRNVKKQAAFMKDLGVNYFTARNYRSGSQRIIHLDTLERICIHLHCTPNDVMEWKPKTELPGHPLNQLKPTDVNALAEKLHKLPLDKLDSLSKWLDEQG